VGQIANWLDKRLQPTATATSTPGACWPTRPSPCCDGVGFVG